MTVPLQILHDAIALHQEGKLDAAESRYRHLLCLVPALADGLHLRGLILRRRGTVEQGARLMGWALRCEPLLVPALLNLTASLIEASYPEAAETALRHLLVVEPESGVALERLGRLRLAAGRLDEAEILLHRARRVGGSDRLELALTRCAQYRRIIAAARDESLPPGIVVRGVFRDSTGYAHKVRQFVRHLVEQGVRVHLIDLLHGPTDDLADGQMDPLFLTLDRPVRARAVLSFTTPAAVEIVPGLMTVNYSVFEATCIPAMWARHSRRHDRIIVATESSRTAWAAAGLPAGRLAVCPEGVEPVGEDRKPPLMLRDSSGRRLADYRTRILNISDFTPRKNLAGLMRTWLRATRPGDDAALVIKVGKSDDAARRFAGTVRRVSEETGIGIMDAAPVFLLDGKFSDEEMLALFATCTHYWSMSHGEGWDLPMSQAGAMGLTLLAPRHSAYTAYLDDRVAHMLPSMVVPAFGEYGGLEWWEPDETAAAELLARLIRDPAAHRRSARAHLLGRFGWQQAAARLVELLSGMGAL